jgi:hypothetical protein
MQCTTIPNLPDGSLKQGQNDFRNPGRTQAVFYRKKELYSDKS